MASGIFSTTFGNGTNQNNIQFSIANSYRDQITSFSTNPSGWFTGHSEQLDNLVISTDSNSIPEPPTIFLFGIGIAALLGRKFKVIGLYPPDI